MVNFWRVAMIGALWAAGAVSDGGVAAAQQADAAASAAAPVDLQGREPLKGLMAPRVVPVEPSPEAKICAEPTSAPKARAENCSALIASGKWEGEKIAWAYANRCVALFKLDQRDKALADCNKALELEPKNQVALQLRGMIEHDRGQDDKALADFDAAVAQGMKNAALFLDRGNILLARGDIERALADYEQAVQINAKSPIVYIARANARLAANDLAGALADGALAEQLAPENETAAFTHGVAALLSGDKATAVTALRKALTLAPKDPYPALWLDIAGDPDHEALAALAKKDDGAWPAPVARFDLAGAEGDKLVETAQTPAQRCEAYFYLGDRLLNKGDKAAGLGALREAMSICPKSFIEYGGARALLKMFDAPAAATEKGEAAKPTPAATDADKAEAAKPQENMPQENQEQGNKTDESKPEANKPDVSKQQEAKPETAAPQEVKPDEGKPDMAPAAPTGK